MAKSVKAQAAKKTGNRRMKRTVRRTIGALCMVSAITVAAIPVPDIEAYNPTQDASKVKAYEDLGITAAAQGDSLTMPTTGLTKEGYAYTLMKDKGVTSLKKQFQFKSDDTYQNAYITGFTKVVTDVVDLSGNMLFMDYVYIDREGADKFELESLLEETTDPTKKDLKVVVHLGEGDANKWERNIEKLGFGYTLTGDPATWSQSADFYKFYKENFPDDFDKYSADYLEYKNAIAADPECGALPPPEVTRSRMDLPKYSTPESQYAYLCDKIFGNGAIYGINVAITTMFLSETEKKPVLLFQVADPDNYQKDLVYLTATNGPIIRADNQGFLCMEFIELVGIKEGALAGITDIGEFILGNKINRICDRAFYRSSMLKKVTFGTSTKIGNQAFSESTDLNTVSLDGVYEIGKEAFAHTPITDIVIPASVSKVEDGAFYQCPVLKTVSFTGVGNSTKGDVIGKGAFCDCGQLTSVTFTSTNPTTGETVERNFASIGDYAFAITDNNLINKDNLVEFKYPDSITTGANLGEFALANRNKLLRVILSSGLDESEEVPDTLVAKCANLEYFRFPKETGGVTYDPTMFYDVVNKNFYVWGPEKHLGSYSEPRKATWQARMNVAASSDGNGDPVTYKYYKDDDETNPATYEISNGFLIQGIDATGKLVNCTYVPGTPNNKKGVDLVIPESVAGININSIDSNCFDKDVKDNVTGIKIDDGNGISTIENDVFKDFEKITYVDLGDGVHTIGDTAFSSCDELKKVTIGENIETIGDGAFKDNPKLVEIHFDTPASLDTLGLEDIGKDAFATGSPKLTVFGEIADTYGPFAWSMQTDNYVDADEGVRVCYKTNSPTNMTVMLDNTNNLPTLLDYPHYDQLDKYAKAAGLAPLVEGPTPGVKIPDPNYSLLNKLASGASTTKKEDDLIDCVRNVVVPSGIKSIDVRGYLTRDASSTGYSNAKNIEVYLDPLTAKDADEKKAGLDYYDEYKQFGLFNGLYGPSDNKKDYELIEPDAYFLSKLEEKDVKLPKTVTGAEYEGNEINPYGNDIVRSITLTDVEYLPDLAFYNCENLEELTLGSKLTDIGELPIADCTKLNTLYVGGKYEVDPNGILYENLGNGKKKIVECFPGQGAVIGYNDIKAENFPELNNVTEIAEGAFANCDDIYFADLTGIQETEIPEYCFYDCDKLKNMTIPENMDNIKANAFGEDPSISLDIKNPDLTPDRDAFGDFKDGENPYIYTTKGSIVERLSKSYGANKLPAIIRYTDEWFTVIFRCNLDGKELYRERVQDGGSPLGPDPDDQSAHEASYAFKHDGYEFAYWADEEGNAITNLRKLAITKDNTLLLGIYEPIKNTTPDVSGDVSPTPSGDVTPNVTKSVPGKTSPTPTNKGGGGSDNKNRYPLTVVYGSGSGNYPEGTKVIIEAIDAPAGKVFDKWVVTGAAATVYSSTSKATTVTTAAGETIITATYKDAGSSSSGGSGGSGTTSTKTSTGTHNRVGADGSPIAGTGSSTRIDITKPGISDVDKAYASVSGSTDSFVVKITESAEAANAVATALANKYGDMTPIKYFAMDISLYDATGTNKITDTTGLKVNVTIPIPDALRQYAGNNKVGAVVNGTQLEDLACKFTTVDGIPCVSFTATHFSPYTIYVDTNNLQVGLMDTSPKTGDPIHPKWFITIALAATSLFLFLKRDKVTLPAKA